MAKHVIGPVRRLIDIELVSMKYRTYRLLAVSLYATQRLNVSQKNEVQLMGLVGWWSFQQGFHLVKLNADVDHRQNRFVAS